MTEAPHTREQRDPFDYSRNLFERLRDYVDERNKHRAAAIATVGEHASQSLTDLHRGQSRPGWVQITFDQHHEDIDEIKQSLGNDGWVRKAFNANADSIAAQNRKLNSIFVAVGLMLVGLLGNLIAIIVGAYR